MSIDPRIMAQLIRLQMATTLNLGSDDSSSITKDTGTNSFNDVLKQFLNSDSSDSLLHSTTSSSVTSLLASGSFGFYPPALNSPSAFDPLISQASNQYGVNSSLIKSVIDAESSFKTHEVSTSGAKGLMQLMDDTGKGLGVTDPFDPQQNIQAGTHFLADLLKQYNGSEATALAAYNAGPGRLASLGITNEQQLMAKFTQLPMETQKYVPKVLNLMQGYQG